MASPPELSVMAWSNRWASERLVDHAVAQHADIFGFNFDHVAGLQIARRIEPRAGAGRGARDNDIAGYERREGRNIIDQVAKAEDQPRRAVILPCFAVDSGRQPD